MPTASCPTNGPYGKFKNRESLDLETLLGEANLPTLLLESTSTLSETASCTSLSCPPFPSTSHSPWLVDDLSGGKDLQNAGPNVPTPPRLRKLAKINRPIRDWAAGLPAAGETLHTPWESQTTKSDTAGWVPEGSLYSPNSFKKALSNARGPSITSVPMAKASPPSDRLPSPPSSKPRSAASCGDLVFERRFSIRTDGVDKRVSVAVPATDMDKETVNMMLELRDLNAFFKNNVDGDRTSTMRCPDALEPPSLVISDSHCVLPLSLDSSSELITSKSTVALRRGKILPPLSFAPPKDDAAYPSIPTAFLGTPSAYSPLSFDRPIEPEMKKPTMRLEDMVGALRLRCAPLHAVFMRAGTHSNVEPDVAVPTFSALPASPSQEASIDEWAFADSLDQSFGEDATILLHMDPESAVRSPDSVDPHSPLQLDTPEPAMIFSNSLDEDKALLTPQEGSPDLTLSPSSSSAPRSILKNRKSVRFASLPAVVSDPSVHNSLASLAQGKRSEPPGPAPRKGQRRGTTSCLPSTTERAFPLYSNIPPKHVVIPPKSVMTGTSATASTPLLPAPSPAGRTKPGISGLKPKSTRGTPGVVPIRPPRPPGLPGSSPKRPMQTPASISAGARRPSPESVRHKTSSPRAIVPTPLPFKASTLGRQSLKSMKSFGKENRGRAASLSPQVIVRTSTLPEQDPKSSRSRGPLRSILTRFK